MCCAYQDIATNIQAYAAAVAIAAPIIPWLGISSTFRTMLTTAPDPVTTQLNPVRPVRLVAVTMTAYPASAAVPKDKSATAREAGQNAEFDGASRRTIHGASNPSASDSQHAA